MTWIAGIDPDTKAITAVFSPAAGHDLELFRVEAKGRLAEHRFQDLAKAFRDRAGDFVKCQWVYIERPPMGVNPRSTIDQSMLVGAVCFCLAERGISYSLVDPGTWKKGLIGRGNADKPLIKEWAIQNLQLPTDLKQDYYDAACIAQWGRSALPGD